jgi:hypothetical protein
MMTMMMMMMMQRSLMTPPFKSNFTSVSASLSPHTIGGRELGGLSS